VFVINSSAVYVKAKAMFAKLFNKKDYEELILCRTVDEVLQFLRDKENYKKHLNEVTDSKENYIEIEDALRNALANDLRIISYYDFLTGGGFYKHAFLKVNASEIIRFLFHLKTNRTKEYVCGVSRFFRCESGISFGLLSKAENYQDFLKAVRKSGFLEVLEKFNEVQIIEIETELYSSLFEKICEIAKENTTKKFYDSIFEFYEGYVKILNFLKILRLKKYKYAPKNIYPLLFRFGKQDVKSFEKYIENEDIENLESQIMKEEIFLSIPRVTFNNIEKMFFFKWANQNIKRATSAMGASFCYILLKEVEVRNIISAIEGIRYDLPQSEVRRLITG
jgi:V/A-type H+-transporting ATPase subunit C